MTEAARSRRDDARQEPQLAIPMRPAPADTPDPLAELARLVGQDDPFRGVFRPAAPAPGREPVHAEPVEAAREFHEDDGHPDDRHGGYGGTGYDDGHAPHPDEHLHPAHGDVGHDSYLAQDERYAAAERAAYPDEAGLADERFAPDYTSPDALPDHWAGGEEGMAPPVDGGAASIRAGGGSPSARRPLLVLAAVLVLTGGGLAASFLAKLPVGRRLGGPAPAAGADHPAAV